MIPNWNIDKDFWHLKVYSATSMFLVQPGVCPFTSPNFCIMPDRLLWCLHGGNTIPMSHPGIFHFPRWVKQSPPGYWGRLYIGFWKLKVAAMHVDSVQYKGFGKFFHKQALYLYSLQSRAFTCSDAYMRSLSSEIYWSSWKTASAG